MPLNLIELAGYHTYFILCFFNFQIEKEQQLLQCWTKIYARKK